MIKQLKMSLIGFVLISILVFYIHAHGFVKFAQNSPIALINLYMFFNMFSILLMFGLSRLKNTKFQDQIGFVYLFSVAVKIILFCLVFYNPIFKTKAFTNIESINILIPIALTLFFEIFFMSKMLKNLSGLKNLD